MPVPEWRRYAAPAGFLLAVTIAVVLIHSGLESGSDHAARQASVPTASSGTTAATTATTTARHASGQPAARHYWTVKAGDTFGVIARQAGVSVADLERLNPKISSTSLTIGEKVRTR